MRICVLIIDDEKPILAALARAEVERWTVTVCSDSAAAEEILRSPAEFDAIIIDLFLGKGKTGQQLYEMMLEDPELSVRCLRVIFHTAGYDHETLIPWFQKMQRPVLMKPIESLSKLEAIVTKVAAQKSPRGLRPKPPALPLTGGTCVTPEHFKALFTEHEKSLLGAIADMGIVRANRSSPPPPASTKHRHLSSIADDDEDDRAGYTPARNDYVIPVGSQLATVVEKVVADIEQRKALELAAGRWGKLVALWREWWKRVAFAVIALSAGALAREVGALVAFAAKHIR